MCRTSLVTQTPSVKSFSSLSGCSDCGKPAVDLHHIDGNTKNNEKGNIAPLCRKCHMDRDGRNEALAQRAARAGRALGKTSHCRNGHAYTPQNTKMYQDARRGGKYYRLCRTCEKGQAARKAAKRKAKK